jgi:hypothetical protein
MVGTLTLDVLGTVTLGTSVGAVVDVLVVPVGPASSSPSPWVSRKTPIPPPTRSSAAMIAMTMPTELFPDGGCPPP